MKNKKILKSEDSPEFLESIKNMPKDSKLFVDKSLAIANKIHDRIVQLGISQKDLSVSLGKTEAEISRALAGMQNFTLRSICKYEAALNFTIIVI